MYLLCMSVHSMYSCAVQYMCGSQKTAHGARCMVHSGPGDGAHIVRLDSRHLSPIPPPPQPMGHVIL